MRERRTLYRTRIPRTATTASVIGDIQRLASLEGHSVAACEWPSVSGLSHPLRYVQEWLVRP